MAKLRQVSRAVSKTCVANTSAGINGPEVRKKDPRRGYITDHGLYDRMAVS